MIYIHSLFVFVHLSTGIVHFKLHVYESTLLANDKVEEMCYVFRKVNG